MAGRAGGRVLGVAVPRAAGAARPSRARGRRRARDRPRAGEQGEAGIRRDGPWWDGDVDAELVEAVLGCRRSPGPARLLLATMAAVADEDGVVRGPVDGAAVRGCRRDRPDIPAGSARVARIRRARAHERPRWPREHEHLECAGSAQARWGGTRAGCEAGAAAAWLGGRS